MSAQGDALEERLKEGEKNLDALRDCLPDFLTNLPERAGLIPPKFARDPNRPELAFWIRMLFSCLVDADYLDTEQYLDGFRAAQRGGHAPLSLLRERFNGYMARFSAPGKEPARGSVNETRAEVLAACRTASRLPPGTFSLTVPTGGGKTLSGMAFAIEHAVIQGKRRIVHVIPYTSIIEQTAGTFAEILGDENVLEHHASLEPKDEDDENGPDRMKLASENWDAPVIVTTSVQFFESLYAARPSKCRKLHRLAGAVIVLDEAQLLPAQLRAPCVDALRQLVEHYGVTLLLSTATQPMFKELNPREIIADPAALYARLRRTRFVWPGDMEESETWPGLAGKLKEIPSFLCIVNTKRDAYELWNALGRDGVFHLSTWMCPRHRRETLREIRRRLRAGEPVRVVSTQLVEAGVDVDFPVVFRALAGMDSLAQAAGRCNREGGRNGLADVHVFVPPKPSPSGSLLRKGEDVTRGLARAKPREELVVAPGMRPGYRVPKRA